MSKEIVAVAKRRRIPKSLPKLKPQA